MYRASFIKLVQPVSIVIATSATSNTATITSVTLANSILTYDGFQTPYVGAAGVVEVSHYQPRLELTNATTVTAYRNTSDGTYTTTVKGTVIEFYAGIINLVQRGTIAITGAATNTATITSVNTAKAHVMYLGNTTAFNFAGGANPVNIYQAHLNLVLTNATTVTCAGGGATGEGTVGYQVVEWK